MQPFSQARRAARRPRKERAVGMRTGEAALTVGFVAVGAALVPVAVTLPLGAVVAVPPLTAVPGRFTAASLARALKPASDREALAAVFSLITMVIPPWQCLA